MGESVDERPSHAGPKHGGAGLGCISMVVALVAGEGAFSASAGMGWPWIGRAGVAVAGGVLAALLVELIGRSYRGSRG
jgi:hypothetical protein